jgi:hypothetical protein
MIELDNTPLILPVDSEHGAIRLSVIGLFMITLVASFTLLSALIPNDGFNLIGGIISLITAGVVTRLGEVELKKRWPSGRRLEITFDGVKIIKNATVEAEINGLEPMRILLWRFPIKKRSRVPKGWYVLACALEQDDQYLTVYTFASPQQTDTINQTTKFQLLESEKSSKSAGIRHDSLRAAGEQRRLLAAESHRWNSGAELSVPDFQIYITRINEQLAQWMPFNK